MGITKRLDNKYFYTEEPKYLTRWIVLSARSPRRQQRSLATRPAELCRTGIVKGDYGSIRRIVATILFVSAQTRKTNE